MSRKDNFVKDMVNLMDLDSLGEGGRLMVMNVMLKYKDDIEDSPYDDIVSERKSNIERERNLKRVLESKAERKTDCSVDTGLDVAGLLRDD